MRWRNSSSWYRTEADGSETLVMLRRNWAMGGYETVEVPQGNRWAESTNTLVLDKTHEHGIARGARGQEFAARELGVSLTGDKAPFDLIAADGTRVDVKTTRAGNPLMVPEQQSYKIDPSRVDAFLLVYDGISFTLVGQIAVTEFGSRCRNDRPFPVPTLYVDAFDLAPVPDSWYTA